MPRVQCFLFPISVHFLIWFNRRLLCLHCRAECETARRRRPAGLQTSIAAPRSLWRLNQVWLMLNKGSADKWNSQRAVMPTSLSSSSPYNCLSVSQQVSPELAAAPLSGPAFYKRLGRKESRFYPHSLFRIPVRWNVLGGGFQTAKCEPGIYCQSVWKWLR